MDLTFTPLDPAAHAELLHGWLTTDRARFWGMTAHSPAQVRAYLERVDGSADEQGWIGSATGPRSSTSRPTTPPASSRPGCSIPSPATSACTC